MNTIQEHTQLTEQEYKNHIQQIETTLDFTTHKIKGCTLKFTPKSVAAFEITKCSEMLGTMPKMVKKIEDAKNFDFRYVQIWEVVSDYETGRMCATIGYFDKPFLGFTFKTLVLNKPKFSFASLCLDVKKLNKFLFFLPCESEFIFNNIETIISSTKKGVNKNELPGITDCQGEVLKYFSPSK